jgi:TolB-like protein/Tfp pilus assembly protein PilF
LSIFNELKRRNVFKVGIAYVVVAWLVAQVTELAAESFGAPEWVMQMLLIVLALGLPVALVLAWALELTPEGIKKEKDVDRSQSIAPQTGKKLNSAILVLMALAITYLLFDKFTGPAQPGSYPFSQQTAGNTTAAGGKRALTPVEAMTEAEPIISKQSIAVLPFDNRSNREEDDFFVEGMHDDLLTNLAKIGSLKVISRTSVARYKNTEIPIPVIARELGVATIMEGAVQRSGNTVRINVQLIDAQTDEHLWAEIFDRELTTENLFSIQTEISRKIAGALEATLSQEEQQRVDERPTENLAAYSAYLRGRQLIARRNAETVDQALIEFQRAVQLDPQFALAWAGIAEAAQLALWVSDMDRPESIQLSQEAVEKALAINDQLGEVQLARATLIRLTQGSDEEIETAYKLAIELSPGYAQAWQAYSEFVSRIPSRLHEALELAENAAELDPLSTAVQNQIIDVLRRLGNYGEAQQRLSQLIEQDPDFAASYELMADIKSETGQFDEAIRWLHKAQSLDPGNIGYVLREMWPQMDIGNTEELDPLIARMNIMDPDSSTLSFMEFWINLYKMDLDAAMEAARLFDQKTGYRPGGKFPQGMTNMLRSDQTAFREIFEEIAPAYFDSKTFQKALEWRPYMSCGVAWSLIHTGDEGLGLDLARQAIEYFKNNLPGSDETITIALCHMVLDRPEQALLVIESAVKSGKVSRWWLELQHPAYQLLQYESRFVAAEADIQSMLARQRENLQQLTLEGE